MTKLTMLVGSLRKLVEFADSVRPTKGDEDVAVVIRCAPDGVKMIPFVNPAAAGCNLYYQFWGDAVTELLNSKKTWELPLEFYLVASAQSCRDEDVLTLGLSAPGVGEPPHYTEPMLVYWEVQPNPSCVQPTDQDQEYSTVEHIDADRETEDRSAARMVVYVRHALLALSINTPEGELADKRLDAERRLAEDSAELAEEIARFLRSAPGE